MRIITFICVFFVSAGTYMVQAQFLHNLNQEKKPWTSAPAINGKNFRFVITGDLTGGEKPGVFDTAVKRINELAPDFVISVGDLIDGYTFDTGLIQSQWERFNGSVEKLEMPFFYVPGNHDVANPVLFETWKNKFGTSWYTFKAGEVLFIVLNTWEPGVLGISDIQLHGVENVIAKHPEEAPVFVFTHDPFWESVHKPGLHVLDSLLKERNVAFFCGHEHRYLHKTVNGKHHYMLSSVASDEPRLEEVSLGRFRNLMMVTVTPEKTSVANLALEGLVSPSVVDNETERQVKVLLQKNWAMIKPFVVQAETANTLTSVLQLQNKGDFPLEINGIFLPVNGYTFFPAEIHVTVPAAESLTVPVSMKTQTWVNFHELHPVVLQTKARFLQEGRELKSASSVKWIIDSWEKCERQLPAGEYRKIREPGELEEGWDWHGVADGNVTYRVSCDEKFIYINLKTSDDSLVVNEDVSVVQDKINLFLTADTAFRNAGYFEFEFVPGHPVLIKNANGTKQSVIEGKCEIQGNSLLTSLKFPRKTLQGNFFRMNFSFTDSDDRTNLEPSVIWWKPRWLTKNDYPQSGIFYINQ